MTQEEKALLLQDLCARLQYNVQVLADMDKTFEGGGISTLKVINLKKDWVELEGVLTPFKFDEIKPYLRPISSMTEEEVDHLFHILKINEENGKEWIKVNDIGIIRLFTEEGKDFYEIAEAMDYLHSIHIDYRGLISKGLAIAVTKENNPYKE